MSRTEVETDPPLQAGYRLWIDGVGCWLLWLAPTLQIGRVPKKRPDKRPDSYRLPLPGNLRTHHATWSRVSGGNLLEPQGELELNKVLVQKAFRILPEDHIHWPGGFEWIWRTPSRLSQSSSVRFEKMRSLDLLDGIVFFDRTCLIGPTSDCHIQSRRWGNQILIYQREERLMIRDLSTQGEQELDCDSVISLSSGSLRLEQLSSN